MSLITRLLRGRPAATLKTHTVYPEIHLGDHGDWVLFFYNKDGGRVEEHSGKAINRVQARKQALAARKKHQDKFERKAV